MKYNQLLVVIVLALTISGCRKQSVTVDNTNRTGGATNSAPANQSSNSTTIADLGDLKLKYQPRKHSRKSDKAAPGVGENEQAIAAVLADLNKKVALPFDVTLSVTDCEEPDAYYDPDAHDVVVCYQLIDQYYELFALKIKDKTKLDEAVKGATAMTFFHELGHALVDAWKLPITGKEEDAVDQVSTLVLLKRSDAGEQMALSGALLFRLYGDLAKGDYKVYWDEHSLDEQRFYDTICMIYGHNPAKYEYLIKDKTLPEERAVMCAADYERIEKSWKTLLTPYLK
jgi:hypothetical protein